MRLKKNLKMPFHPCLFVSCVTLVIKYLSILLNLIKNRGLFYFLVYSLVIKLLNTCNKIGLPEMYSNETKRLINFIRITEHSNSASGEKAHQ